MKTDDFNLALRMLAAVSYHLEQLTPDDHAQGRLESFAFADIDACCCVIFHRFMCASAWLSTSTMV